MRDWGPKVVLERSSGLEGTSRQKGWVSDILIWSLKKKDALEQDF